jgi:spore protease
MADERVDEYKIINNLSSIDGIEIFEEKYDEFKITQVNVLNENGAEAIDKKIGKYITFEMENVKYIDDREKVVEKLKKYINELIEKEKSVMVVGLGNLYVTPDALGSKVVNRIEVTRHILKLAKHMINSNTREISAICPGVMGNTGIQTSEIITAISNIVKPKYIIAIDSLMSKSIKRIGSSIQISNTGITPGSGITGINNCIDRHSTGATVISLGVPMVVDMATITNDALNKIENKNDEDGKRYYKIANILDTDNYIVTPKDIDELVEIMSEIIAESINKAM